jgi:inositol oxygenase
MSQPTKATELFRDYSTTTPQKQAIAAHYRKMREHQTVDYVRRMKAKYLTFSHPLHVWQAMEELNALVDVSDPDIALPNTHHLLQTAEALRADNRPDWMQLVGLLHDLGKVMFLWGCDEDGTSIAQQFGLVGDIFVVGCSLPDSVVFPEFNALNPDMADPRYNTELGQYEPHCGLDKLELAWGHDEYLYQVLKNHKACTIPQEGLVMIRYHSFYPWHTGGAYTALLNPATDAKYLELIRDFNKSDLYSKVDKPFDMAALKEYYQGLIEKYLGTEPIHF